MLEILNSVWENEDHTAMTVWISNEIFQNLPFGVNLNIEDDSPIYKEIVQRYKNKEFEPDPYVEPEIPEEDLRRIAKHKRDKLLNETLIYTASDAPLSDKEKEELSEYRSALWNILNTKSFKNIEWPKKPSWLNIED